MIWEVDAEVAGGLGRDMDYKHERSPRLIGRLHYVFDGWLGDDIVTTASFWLVSERLAAALRNSELTGFELEDALVTVSDTWRTFKGDAEPGVWTRLVPVGDREHGSDFFVENNGTRLFVSDRAAEFLRGFTVQEGQLLQEGEPEPANPAFDEFLRRRGGDVTNAPDHGDLSTPPPTRFADLQTEPAPSLTAASTATSEHPPGALNDIQPLAYEDLTGDLRTLIDAMRQKVGSPKFQAALSLLGEDEMIPSAPSGDFGGFDAFSSGLSLITEKEKLYQVLLYLEPKAKATGPYPRAHQLCDQFDVQSSTREENQARFGKTLASKADWDTYDIGERVTFFYNASGTVSSLAIHRIRRPRKR